MLPNPTLSMLFPAAGKPLEITGKCALEFLWLRPQRVHIAKLEYARTTARLVQSCLDLIRDVRVAFTDLTLADVQCQVLDKSADVADQIETMSRAE